MMCRLPLGRATALLHAWPRPGMGVGVLAAAAAPARALTTAAAAAGADAGTDTGTRPRKRPAIGSGGQGKQMADEWKWSSPEKKIAATKRTGERRTGEKKMRGKSPTDPTADQWTSTERKMAGAKKAGDKKAGQPPRSEWHFFDDDKHMLQTYPADRLRVVKASRDRIWDVNGKSYIDWTSGISVVNLGHSNEALNAVLCQQTDWLVHCSNVFYNEWPARLCARLVVATNEAAAKAWAKSVFLCSSGTEANEAAIKFARAVGKVRDPSGLKHGIVSFTGGFHGRTMGSLSATNTAKYRDPFLPLVPGFSHGTYNDVDGIEALVTEQTCGVLVEPVQGEGGVHVATTAFLTRLQTRCREVGALLIMDEVQCGLGRTGELWAHQAHNRSGLVPDVLTTAKALGNGLPIGAVVVNAAVHAAISPGQHGTTFGGNPLICRVANRALAMLAMPRLHQVVRRSGTLLRAHLDTLQRIYPDYISEVRGAGLMIGLQLTRDPAPLLAAARQRGLLMLTSGANTVRILPTLTQPRQVLLNVALPRLRDAIVQVCGRRAGVEAIADEQLSAPDGRVEEDDMDADMAVDEDWDGPAADR